MRLVVAVVALGAALGCASAGGGGGGGAGGPKHVALPSGLELEDLEVGSGPEAGAGKTIIAHYTGWLTDGTRFDTSKGGEPLVFKLGTGMVIKGWDEGIAGMKVGGRRKLTVPARLAYGAKGKGSVPPNATLVFEVELLGVH
jgi:FKBP-type peptidyl-prolyl cis-trans isomerase FkpA